MIMKRFVVTFDCQYKQAVLAYLVSNRVQYSMSVDIYMGDVRVSVPSSKGAAFLADLRRSSIPYVLF